MRKEIIFIIALTSLLMINLPFVNATGSHSEVYLATDENAVFEKITYNDDMFAIQSNIKALSERFDRFIPFLKLEDNAAIRTLSPSDNPNNEIEQESLVPIIQELEEKGTSIKEISEVINEKVPSTRIIIEIDGSVIIVVNQAEVTKTDRLRARFLGYEFFSAEIDGDKIIYDDVSYQLQVE